MMRPTELRELLRRKPFLPLRVGLADGRCIIVRHPDQVVVAERNLLIGLARIERSRPMLTPARSETIAREWLIVSLVQITTIEPENGTNGRLHGSRRRGRK